MKPKIVDRAYEFAKWSKVNAIVLSGGEFVLHPDWWSIADRFASGFAAVTIPTNGMWLFDRLKRDEILALLDKHSNVKVH